jgi:hypothetical protein
MSQPTLPQEHPHAGHPTLKAIAAAVRDGREVWSVKELQDVFPGMSERFLYDLTSGRLEVTQHSSSRSDKRPTCRISTRSLITYFLEVTTGLGQPDIIHCISLLLPSLSRKALLWIRAQIDRQLAQPANLHELQIPAPEVPQTRKTPSLKIDSEQPTLFAMQ